MRMYQILFFCSCIASLTGCGCSGTPPARIVDLSTPSPNTSPSPVQQYTYTVTKSYPHDTNAFTEGLLFKDDNTLWESVGLNNQSDLRVVDLATGAVKKKIPLASRYFGEGLTEFKGKLYQLTWQENVCFVYDASTLEKIKTFSYKGEGWGITHDDTHLIMSNGTDKINFVNPDTFKIEKTISVSQNGYPQDQLNELEYIEGEIWSNVWHTDLVLRIDPSNGNVKGVINFSSLLPESDKLGNTDVLNGIAYNKNTKKIYVTGKNWPKIFEVEVIKS
jgi:glutaminyl-peptide cyclotransferase